MHHLVGFRSVHLEPGADARITVDCSVRPVQRWSGDGFTLAPADIAIRAASFAGDPAALDATFTIPK